MRRLALFCGGFAAGIFLAQYLLPGGWLLSGGLMCLALGFGALLLPECWRKRAILCLVGAALALGWNWLYVRQVSEPMEALADTQQALTMTLTEYPTETRFGAKVTVRAEGLPGKLTYYGDPPLLQLLNLHIRIYTFHPLRELYVLPLSVNICLLSVFCNTLYLSHQLQV